MKESERMLQWCPHRRMPIALSQPGNDAWVAGNSLSNLSPPPTLVELGTCIGHQCSQWRWETDPFQRIFAHSIGAIIWVRGADGSLEQQEPARPIGMPASFLWNPRINAWQHTWPAGERQGHCGLAGDAAYD